MGIASAYIIFLIHRQNKKLLHVGNPPVTVEFKETNLPIVFINTNGELKSLRQGKSINSQICIVNNGDGQTNHTDTSQFTQQHVDFYGNASIHCRGEGSMKYDKKSFSIKLLSEAPATELKKGLLGMKSSDKWYLIAVYLDGTMMRDALTYELARPYFDFVPQVRYCEVVINGVYQGVYLLIEPVTKDLLGLEKFDKNDHELRGGYLLEKDRDETFKSTYPALDCSGNEISSEGISFEVKYPKPEKLTSAQLQHIQNDLAQMEDAVSTGQYSEYSRFIDVLSFASYQLVQEFSNNRDAYICSHKIYKPSGEAATFKMALWDFDIAYGNSPGRNGWFTDVNRYQVDCEENRLEPFWWNRLMQDTTYRQIISRRWQQFRNEEYSNGNIERKIDSLYKLLTQCHAIERNQTAWNITPNAWLSLPLTFEESVHFLKLWIISRLDYMDAELIGTPRDEKRCDSVYREMGKMILCKDYAIMPTSSY